jgi:hypothetical protein
MRENEGVFSTRWRWLRSVLPGGFALMAATPQGKCSRRLAHRPRDVDRGLPSTKQRTTLFARAEHNRLAGELMSFIAGGAYVSFERIRHLHLRHHRDRADVTCFDYKAFLRKRPLLRHLIYSLEWAHLPAVETLMHLQVILRPLLVQSQRRYLPRTITMLVRGRRCWVQWHGSHSASCSAKWPTDYCWQRSSSSMRSTTFDQYFTDAVPVPLGDRDRNYEQRIRTQRRVGTLSVAQSGDAQLRLPQCPPRARECPLVPPPALHKELFAGSKRELMSLREVLRSFHRNRLKRCSMMIMVASAIRRADGYVWRAHGVSFTVV